MTQNNKNINVVGSPDGGNGGFPRLRPEDEIIEKASWIDYRDNTFVIPQLIKLLSDSDYGRIDLFPEYQRRIVWTVEQQSGLVESILLGVPIPSVFMFENGIDDYEVIDGLQRINSIRGFRNNEFKLSGLKEFRALEGLSYETCNPVIQGRFDRAKLPAKILTMLPRNGNGKTEEFAESDIRRFIFSRINSGGKQLNEQQLRNAVYKTNFNSAINELSKTAEFRDAFDIPKDIDAPSNLLVKMTQGHSGLYYDMKDCEMVLSFFALRGGHKTGALEEILDNTMENEKSTDVNRVNELKVEFLDRLKFLMELFDNRPFDMRPPYHTNRKISIEMYVALMITIDSKWEEKNELLQRRQKIKEAKNFFIADTAVDERIQRDKSGNYMMSINDSYVQILEAGK